LFFRLQHADNNVMVVCFYCSTIRLPGGRFLTKPENAVPAIRDAYRNLAWEG
jgi:hypothetical protein